MILRIAQVLIYIVFCTLLRVGPWRYFQLNAGYFNRNKGIFSKLDIDQLIPPEWRLEQWVDHSGIRPMHYPVFLKPEWGQNSKGIQRADNLEEFEQLRLLKPNSNVQYLVQQGAKQSIEFEIFLIPSPLNTSPLNTSSLNTSHFNSDTSQDSEVGVISVTQVSNTSTEIHPINGIYNSSTEYKDISSQLSTEQKQHIYYQLRTVGNFNIARYGIRSNSIAELLQGNFSIIEINLFFPMPLILLSNNVSLSQKWSFIVRNMWLLAQVTKAMNKEQPFKDIFFKKMEFFSRVKDFEQKELN
jgi:hypothetical protein